MYFSSAFFIRKRASEEQRLRLNVLNDALYEKAQDERFKITLERFKRLELREKMIAKVH